MRATRQDPHHQPAQGEAVRGCQFQCAEAALPGLQGAQIGGDAETRGGPEGETSLMGFTGYC